MSDNLPKTTQTSEEVDLAQLFKMIGNGFDRFFKFIASIFKKSFHLLIIFLLFIKKHFLKFAVAGVLGLGVGYFLDGSAEIVYESEMILEPNFNSAQQLYNNINFYNELAQVKDSVGLSIALGISTEEASSIRSIYADAYSDENQKIRLFNEFIKDLDSTTKSTIDYKEYLKNFNTFDSRFHRIVFVSTDLTVAKKTENKIVNAIIDNKYFKSQKEINDTIIKLQENIYRKQLREIDSLQRFYKELALENARKDNASTSINLAENNGLENKELDLINEVEKIKGRIVDLNKEKAITGEVINVISAFPSQGVKIGGLIESNKLFFFAIFLGITLLGLMMIELNSFLKTYKEKHLS